MSVRAAERTLGGAIGALLIVQLLTCFIAIGMLERLRTPLDDAVHRAAAESAAIRRSLSALARVIVTRDTTVAQQFDAAVHQLTLTEPTASSPELKEILRSAPLALQGDVASVDRTTGALERLAETAQKRLDAAKVNVVFQSRAAAWVFVFVGFLLTVLATLVRGLLSRALVQPLAELARVIAARVQGDTLARAAQLPPEAVFAPTILALNQMLDGLAQSKAPESDASALALVALLNQRGDACAIVDDQGQMVAMSRRVLDRVTSERSDQVRELLRRIEEQPCPEGITLRQALGEKQWLVVLSDD